MGIDNSDLDKFKIANCWSDVSNTTRMTIDRSGNMGIGTTSPNAPLQFPNTIQNRKIVLWEVGNNDHQFYGFGLNGNTLRYQTATSTDDHVFFSGNGTSASTELMRIKGSGNVGIGTTSPAAKLDVNGNMNIANEIRFTNASTMKGLVWGDTSNSNYYSRIDDSGNLKILTDDLFYIGQVNSTTGAANSNYTLTANVGTGSVFIGFDATNKFSSSPNLATSSLYVSKGVTSENFVMSNVSGWSDFVFAKDYKLPSLEETENFIRTNKHLPNIPSEAEVKKNGYSLHEMNRGLLQTMEEMTLHGIAQEKKINQQEAIVAEQATQIKTMVSELAEIKALLQAKK